MNAAKQHILGVEARSERRRIQHDSPEVARKVATIIMGTVGGLSIFPKRGRTAELVESKAPAIWSFLPDLGSLCSAFTMKRSRSSESAAVLRIGPDCVIQSCARVRLL
jgi:hypothetical protein